MGRTCKLRWDLLIPPDISFLKENFGHWEQDVRNDYLMAQVLAAFTKAITHLM